MRRRVGLALAVAMMLSVAGLAQDVGTSHHPILMILVPSTHGEDVIGIGEQIAAELFELTGYYIEPVCMPDFAATVEAFAASEGDIFGFAATQAYPLLFERTDGKLSLRLAAIHREESVHEDMMGADCVCFSPGFPSDVEDALVEAIQLHIDTPRGAYLWSDPQFYGWTGVAQVSEGFLSALQASGGLSILHRPCVTETPPPTGTEPEGVIRYAEDPTEDFEIDHPMFAELYDIVFELNTPIPPALDLVEVVVESGEGGHTFYLRTRDGGVIQEMRDLDQRATYGVYIDSDGNGVSDVTVTTTIGGERSVILTPEFELVDATSELWIEDDLIALTVPEWVIGAGFHWMAFSGYSPNPHAAYTTSMDDVVVVPDVDVVCSQVGMNALLSFLDGPGTCQITEKLAVACCGGTCAKSASVPYTTIPGTNQTGRLFYRKQCGQRIYEFWCLGACFGSRVYGGATTGWVGRCPYPCGFNTVNVWKQDATVQLDKVYHTIRDASCASKADMKNPLKHADSWIGGKDGRMDSMHHTYWYGTDQLTSCNVERQPGTATYIDQRCCNVRKPYVNLSAVPGRIDDKTTDCPTTP